MGKATALTRLSKTRFFLLFNSIETLFHASVPCKEMQICSFADCLNKTALVQCTLALLNLSGTFAGRHSQFQEYDHHHDYQHREP